MKYCMLFAFSALSLSVMSQPLLAGKTVLPAVDDLTFDHDKHRWVGKTKGQYSFQLRDENGVPEDDSPVDFNQVQLYPGFVLSCTTTGRTIRLVTKREEDFPVGCHVSREENGRMVIICP